MSRELCPDGHVWQTQPGEIPGQQSLVCVVCGLVADFASDDVAPTCQAGAKDAEGSAVQSQVRDPTWPHVDMETSARRDPYPLSTPAEQEIVPGYEILRELGRGGMGVVYKARQVNLQRIVALKMILVGAHARSRDLDRFKTEAQAVARLHHPNIVEIYEFGEHQGLPYYSLEYVEGGSLAKKMRGQPLPAAEAARIAQELARAIHYCHVHGILHRDLKPSNILLTADRTPKISDFGLAKELNADGGLTKSGMVMGTPSYMAPEQTQGRCRDVGPHTDVYALGAILYEMLAGRPPFKTDSILETMEQVGSREPPPPSRFQSKVPRDLETICLKAMAKEPTCRYRTALAFAEDLERFEAGGSILARREGTWARLWRKARRRRLITTAFLLVIAMTAGPGVFFYQRAARIQSLNEELEDGLEVREWTAAHLQRMEDVAVRLESINPEWSPWKVQRVHSRFARSIRDSLSQDSDLPERDIWRIEAALDVLALRDSTQADELRQQLRTRSQQSHKKETESGP